MSPRPDDANLAGRHAAELHAAAQDAAGQPAVGQDAAPGRRFPPLPGPPLAVDADAAQLARLTQGSAAWIAARVGRVTASRIADVVGRTRAGYAAARGAYLTQILAERLSGRASEPYVTPAMAWGRRHEAGARAAYEFFRGVDVALCGFLVHPSLPRAGASPDGLVGDDGLLEVKCPTTAAHLDVVLRGAPPERHVLQMQWQMACAGRRWCDYVSYDPRLPEPTRIAFFRVERDDAVIATLEYEVRAFLDEVETRVAQLRAAVAPSRAAHRALGTRPDDQPAVLRQSAAGTEPVRSTTAARKEEGAGSEAPQSGAGLNGRLVAPRAAAARNSDPSPRTDAAAPRTTATPNGAVPQAPRAQRAREIVDVASQRRKPLSPRQRLALYEAHGGICCICGNRIIGGRWVDEHIRPLSLGGSNDLDNRAPAHERCAQEKTRDDLRRLAKAKAQKRAHVGLKAATRLIASRPFPATDRVRPNLSPLGPPRAARLRAERAADPPAEDPDGV